MEVKPKKSKPIRILLIFAGSISLFFGVLGIFLPILPTTPFLLLSAAFYFHGSKRMYNWLLNNKVFGKYIKDYREKKGIALKIKIIALSVLWLTILNCVLFFILTLIIKLLLVSIAIVVSLFILKQKTIKT